MNLLNAWFDTHVVRSFYLDHALKPHGNNAGMERLNLYAQAKTDTKQRVDAYISTLAVALYFIAEARDNKVSRVEKLQGGCGLELMIWIKKQILDIMHNKYTLYTYALLSRS